MKFIHPSGSPAFNFHNPKVVKLLTRLRLSLTHLREHKFKHSLKDTLNPIYNCSKDIETSAHFFLHCPIYSYERSKLDRNILTRSDFQVTETILYDDSNSNNITNTLSHLECYDRFPNSQQEIWWVSLLDWIWLNCIIRI